LLLSKYLKSVVQISLILASNDMDVYVRMILEIKCNFVIELKSGLKFCLK